MPGMAPPSVHQGIKKKKEREYKYRQSRPMYLERVRGESIRKKKEGKNVSSRIRKHRFETRLWGFLSGQLVRKLTFQVLGWAAPPHGCNGCQHVSHSCFIVWQREKGRKRRERNLTMKFGEKSKVPSRATE